jgi:hypothetical protein
VAEPSEFAQIEESAKPEDIKSEGSEPAIIEPAPITAPVAKAPVTAEPEVIASTSSATVRSEAAKEP